MKRIKLLSTIAFLGALLCQGVQAQEPTGELQALPKGSVNPIPSLRGDIGIVVSANPVLNFAGNLFNFGASGFNNIDDWFKNNTYTLGVRYHVLDNLAVRGFFSFNPNKNAVTTTTYPVVDDAARLRNPNSEAKVYDQMKVFQSDYTMRLGAQYYRDFRGKGRLKGFGGADLIYGWARESATYTYGNAMTKANSTPSTGSSGSLGSGRLLERKDGLKQTLGLYLFGGVEWYFHPAVCMGLEGGINLKGTFSTHGYDVVEKMEKGQRTVIEKSSDNNFQSGSFTLNTSLPVSGQIYFTFLF